jgi:hypothetical protein
MAITALKLPNWIRPVNDRIAFCARSGPENLQNDQD